jgi:hypothetical protein
VSSPRSFLKNFFRRMKWADVGGGEASRRTAAARLKGV